MGGAKESKRAIDTLSDEFFRERKADLSRRLKPERFEHSLGVSETAVMLSETYGVSAPQARLAGLLHDWDKCYSNKQIRIRAQELCLSIDPFVYKNLPQLLHGPTAALALKRDFPDLPAEVLQSIARHTTGELIMTGLDMVVYVADAIEPNRDYSGLSGLRELVDKVSLDELYFASFSRGLMYLIEQKRLMYPQTIRQWNYYLILNEQKKGRA